MKKVFLAVIAVSLICMQTVSFSATDNLEEIAEKEDENKTLTAEITKLNTEIEATRLEIAQLQQQIDDSDVLINNLNKQIDGNKEALKERLLNMYLSGSASNLEILLDADSLDDLMNKIEYMSIVAENDSELIGDLTQQVNTSTKAKKVLNSNLTTLDNQQKNFESKRNDFQSLLKSNQDRLSFLYAEGALNALPSDDSAYAYDGSIISYYDKLQNSNNNTQQKPQQATQNNNKKPNKPNKGNSSSNSTSSNNSNSGNSGSTVIVKPKPVPTPTQPPIPTQPPVSGDIGGNAGNNDIGGSITPIAGYTWPVPGFYHLTSLWDEDRGDSNHGALDIASAGVEGANVVAAHSGIVDVAQNDCVHNWGKDSSCGCGGGYGNWVRIDHGDGYSTIYAHMSSITVGYGDYVEAGQLLGFVGSTGYSTGAHLHFETLYFDATTQSYVKYNPLLEYPNISITY